jgi:hypothetical protein
VLAYGEKSRVRPKTLVTKSRSNGEELPYTLVTHCHVERPDAVDGHCVSHYNGDTLIHKGQSGEGASS